MGRRRPQAAAHRRRCPAAMAQVRGATRRRCRFMKAAAVAGVASADRQGTHSFASRPAHHQAPHVSVFIKQTSYMILGVNLVLALFFGEGGFHAVTLLASSCAPSNSSKCSLSWAPHRRMPSSSCPEPPASLLTCRSGAGLRSVPQGSQDGDLWLHLRPARGQPAVVVSSAQHATAACRLMLQHAWLGQHCRHGCSTHCKAGQAQQAFKLSPCLTVCATSLLYSQAACCAAHRLNCGHPPGDGLARQGGSGMSGFMQHRLPVLHRAALCWLLQLAHLTPVSVAMGSSRCSALAAA